MSIVKLNGLGALIVAGLKSKNPAIKLGSLNSDAGLGIISTINVLFVIGFVGISCKQRPHEGPHKKSLCFCDGYYEKSSFSEWGLRYMWSQVHT
ncbi:TPA: hypothetical protein I8190_002890 [Citrobacter freundii]|nr:hypothetical protein [Citrobacter farmeri]HAT2286135.1 hypothetical protein [Citrobacter freundii]HAT2350129.1 hypothetical protein [Citrobacter freundii]HAT2430500.1 hypothetical protein [Citrobacter freundii]HAT2499011.1 hypothetical protein [Citrobacter freundii]